MSQTVMTVERIGKSTDRIATSKKAISLSVNINADALRVFYALTIPEYIETWSDFPGFDRIACTDDTISELDFRYDLYSANVVKSSIYCHRIVSTPEHVKFSWKNADGRIKPTIVDIRLRHSKGACTVRVNHHGFSDTVYFLACSEFWRSSLNKLSHILEK
jgi:uncharacterized protein YndB with AHSA1/START domain